MEYKIKNGLFIFLFIVLLLPAAQQFLPFAESGKLYGFFEESKYRPFSWSGWWDGSYREETSKYLNDQAGFRADIVRMNNQLEYTLFGKLRGAWLAPGKDHYLFQTHHINAYYGRDYIGYNAIRTKLSKYKAICDTLSRLGKTIILIHSPCKAFYYPEYLPDAYKSAVRQSTNYETYSRLADSMNINQIDFNAWFVSMKQTTTHPLYTKQGIHWSVYGSLLAADSLINYLEGKRNKHMRHPVWTSIVRTNVPRDPDDDLAKTTNLVYPLVTETFSYPVLFYAQSATAVRPATIYIGDSFLDTWQNSGLLDSINTGWQIWNHFSGIKNKDYRQSTPDLNITNYDWIDAVKNTDCIIIMYTSFNMNELGDGFIEKTFDHFYPSK